MSVFTDIAGAFGNATGSSPVEGGYLIGFIFLFAIFIALVFLLPKDNDSGGSIVLVVGVSIASFNVLVGWWPIWVIFLIFLVVALLLVKPFGNKGE